jgi:formylglycine-generating enzyme required for sulfatase activity
MTRIDGSRRAIRGGSCLSNGYCCKVSHRDDYYPSYRFYSFGFRPVRRCLND